VKLSSALIGSCTNSSYEDIGRSTFVAQQAMARRENAISHSWFLQDRLKFKTQSSVMDK
jgi:aconitase A